MHAGILIEMHCDAGIHTQVRAHVLRIRTSALRSLNTQTRWILRHIWITSLCRGDVAYPMESTNGSSDAFCTQDLRFRMLQHVLNYCVVAYSVLDVDRGNRERRRRGRRRGL